MKEQQSSKAELLAARKHNNDFPPEFGGIDR